MPRIRREPADERRSSKSVWLAAYIVLAVLAIGTAKVQLWPDRRIVLQSQKQYWANVAVSASRGKIEDRRGVPLAISVPSTSFFIDPKYWDPASADVLKGTFGAASAKKFSRELPGRFHWVGRSLPKERADKLADMKVPGLYTLSEKRRIYPHESLAFHVLGFCDIDEYGQAGVELAWNHILYSPPRTRFLARDSKGNAMDIMSGRSGVVKDTAGSIKLTIDSRVQQIMEWRLSEGAKAVDAAWASGVCVDPYTGEIVALASYPTLNPNNRKNLANTNAVRNNAVGRVFEPGSIFKPITMSIALETGSAGRNSSYTCHGTMKLFDRTMSDVNKRAHGKQDLTHVLMNSCNIGMSLMSMGVPKYQAYGMLKQFGFGDKTEVEIAGEESGLIKQPEEWLGTVPANIFIGQGIAVTPLQIVMAISSLANGGTLLKPYVIDEVRDSLGKVIHKGTRRVRYQVVSRQTSDFIREAMRRVVAEGGGKLAKSDKVSIAGKTGTAQIAASGQYAKGQYVASFVGFWPAEKPQYVMLISIGEPKGARYYGGQIAAPVFKSIVEDIVQIAPGKI
ncbi:penicillin-binding protein 2 [Cloacibacillus evryensis]|mgnify:FL=1|uniref:peptidoglycan D,D-transpeptidase FtsI family protein n=1 Tax=Cloacibacillus evryensis TaxID=508460 RepID=UPI00210F0859|nr:penicillin-binding protein 2 [Cloacibacillus evryensis]MCQ4763114.1 penicillin-binding protein 2 [Cloacibacillus evryensis]